jgi:DHA1 family bicyclomycin/chloramphenicol resistance-like MFS transporter
LQIALAGFKTHLPQRSLKAHMTEQTTVSAPPRTELIALLAGFMALNAIAVDVMLPALPAIAETLMAGPENQQQWVLAIYMFGFGFGQLIFGPLSDTFGRRNLLILGALIYLVAAAAAVFSPTYSSLLVMRFVQGMGSAATRVVSQSIIRDLFKGSAMAEVLSLVLLVFMIVPLIAPSVGQVILLTGDWHNIFWFMALMGAITLVWAFVRLPETLHPDNRRALTMASIFNGFGTVFSNRISMSYIFASTFVHAGLIAFIFTSEQVFVDIYDLGPLFPIAFAGISASLALASFINSKAVSHFGTRRIAHTGLLLFMLSAAIMLILSLRGPIPLPIYFALLATITFMFGWTLSNMTSLALTPLGKVAGSASAVHGTVQTLISTTLGTFVGQMFNGTTTPLALGLTLFGASALAAAAFAENGKMFQRRQE